MSFHRSHPDFDGYLRGTSTSTALIVFVVLLISLLLYLCIASFYDGYPYSTELDINTALQKVGYEP